MAVDRSRGVGDYVMMLLSLAVIFGDVRLQSCLKPVEGWTDFFLNYCIMLFEANLNFCSLIFFYLVTSTSVIAICTHLINRCQ